MAMNLKEIESLIKEALSKIEKAGGKISIVKK